MNFFPVVVYLTKPILISFSSLNFITKWDRLTCFAVCSCIPWGAYTLKRVFFILCHTTSSILAGLFGTGCLRIKHWHRYWWSHNTIQYSLFPNKNNAVEKKDFLHFKNISLENWSKYVFPIVKVQKQNKTKKSRIIK